MKLKQSLLISLLTLAVSPALAQTSTVTTTPTPVWSAVVPSESLTTTLTLPAGATIRWCDTATNRICSPAEVFAAQTVITAFCPSVGPCATADLTDGLNGVPKSISVLEMAAAQTVTVTDSSVKPAKVTTATVPALPPANYPPVTFKPNVSYTFTVASVPADADGIPKFSLTLTDGANAVCFVCKYGATLMTAAGDTAGAFPCIPTPPAAATK
jgi:hypothetical protein